MFPRTATGAAGVLPAPPWHYSGELLTIEYRTDPAAVAELLPAPLELGRRRPRRGRRSSGPTGRAAATRSRSCSTRCGAQYMETFVVVRCTYQGRDVQPVRLHLGRQGLRDGARPPPGLPEEAGRAGPDPSGHRRQGRAAARAGRPLRRHAARPTVAASSTPRSRSPAPSETAGFVNGHPMLHHRRMPAIEMRRHRLAARAGDDARLRRRGRPVLRRRRRARLYDSPVEELTRLAPIEMIGGYWPPGRHELVAGGTTLWAAPNPIAGD